MNLALFCAFGLAAGIRHRDGCGQFGYRFITLGLRRLLALVSPNNIAWITVLKKIGMEFHTTVQNDRRGDRHAYVAQKLSGEPTCHGFRRRPYRPWGTRLRTLTRHPAFAIRARGCIEARPDLVVIQPASRSPSKPPYFLALASRANRSARSRCMLLCNASRARRCSSMARSASRRRSASLASRCSRVSRSRAFGKSLDMQMRTPTGSLGSNRMRRQTWASGHDEATHQARLEILLSAGDPRAAD
jgi:hypothetical protein